MRTIAAATAISLALGLVGAGQGRDERTFEVASVRPNTSGETRTTYARSPSGSIVISNGTVLQIIRQAYEIPAELLRFTVTGGAQRVLESRFDINAKAPVGRSVDDLPATLRGLLADRFKLESHIEKRDVPAYALIVTAKGGAFGPNFRPSRHNCVDYYKARADGVDVAAPADAAGVGWCGQPTRFQRQAIQLREAGAVSTLVARVQPFADRPVVDMSRLVGNYEWDVTFGSSGEKIESNTPGLFTAFAEQLGLRLEPQRAQLNVRVIDRIEMPETD